MKITVLVDNNTIIDSYYLGEPAVSYYIEESGKKILFDTGYSDAYIKNASKLGIDLTKIDTLVLSHAHNDHTGGLSSFPEASNKPLLLAHPLIWEKRNYEGLDVGVPFEKSKIENRFQIHETSKSYQITSKLFYLGEIERTNDFENQSPIGTRVHEGQMIDDYLPDDTALAYVGLDGLYIITGCSHCGICNIIEYAKKVTGVDTVKGIIGGFHLMDAENNQCKKTIDYFMKAKIDSLYPCHCTCFAARAALHSKTPIHEVGSGMSIEWN